LRSDSLHGLRSDRPDQPPGRSWLADDSDRVRLDPALERSQAHHRLKDDKGTANRGGADVGNVQVGPEVRHDLRSDLAELVVAEMRQDVEVPHACVALQRRRREVRFRVEPPPLLREVGEPFLASVELGECAEPLSSLDLGLEGDSVPLTVECPAPVASCVAVAHFHRAPPFLSIRLTLT
jgi:hypothetical protein